MRKMTCSRVFICKKSCGVSATDFPRKLRQHWSFPFRSMSSYRRPSTMPPESAILSGQDLSKDEEEKTPELAFVKKNPHLK